MTTLSIQGAGITAAYLKMRCPSPERLVSYCRINHRQHRTLHVQKDVLPCAVCQSPCPVSAALASIFRIDSIFTSYRRIWDFSHTVFSRCPFPWYHRSDSSQRSGSPQPDPLTFLKKTVRFAVQIRPFWVGTYPGRTALVRPTDSIFVY